MKQVMIKSLTVTSFLIILILLVIEIAKYKVPEYFPADTLSKLKCHTKIFMNIIRFYMYINIHISASKNKEADSNGLGNIFDMAETDNQRNHYRERFYLNRSSLDMFFPIINTCILGL